MRCQKVPVSAGGQQHRVDGGWLETASVNAFFIVFFFITFFSDVG
jgi:hypothetical protein